MLFKSKTSYSCTTKKTNICERFIEKSRENIKSETDDCLSTMNDTNLEKMTPKRYNRVPVEEFNDDDIEIIWGDEWQEVV